MTAPTFSEEDDRKIDERGALGADLVYEVIRREGAEELARPLQSLAFSGFAAGLAISVSVVAEAIIAKRLPDAEWAGLIADFGYCFGFLIVIVGRLQLFTEHAVTAVLPVTYAPTASNFMRLFRLWSIVLAANVVGAIIAGGFLVGSGALGDEGVAAVLDIGRHMTGDPFFVTFVKGVGAGFLIAALVWMLPSAGASQIGLIVLVTWLIAAAGFAHVVAGTAEIAALVFAGEVTTWSVFSGFWLPALLGNMLGGAGLFTLLAYCQVRKEI
ncbi:MAG: formate/nitrite transporter family protein [Pseudomonadota bacterium]